MIFDGDNVSFIDPANNYHDGYYTVHNKRDEVRPQEQRMNCLVPGDKQGNLHPINGSGAAHKTTSGSLQRISNGYDLRTYRLALSSDHQYADSATRLPNPTKAQVLSKMTTTLNRVNGVYERELSITMVFVPNEDTLIFNTADNDPFSDANDDASGSLAINQVICDSFIGTANYDIGHIFTTGAGGLSSLGCVCNSSMKAQSVTGSALPVGDGFDIDYVAHEMGHEFGSQHTFNDNISKNCKDNAVQECAFEPGSGSTIMCYAGICSPDDVQPHSDAYFSTSSLIQMQAYFTTAGDLCSVKTPTNNKLVYLPGFSGQFYVPYMSPFELTAPVAIDSVDDTLITYCWEEWDLGDFGETLTNTHEAGPIFRSFTPSTSPTKMFPSANVTMSGVLSNAGVEDASGEKVPDVPRGLNFRLTVRDIYAGHGCFLIPEDSIHVDAVNTGGVFKVTSQDTPHLVFLGNTKQVVTWDVAGTDAAPISASTVDIYMTGDSARTWPYFLGTFPNTGSATILLPNPDVTIPFARFKVKGTNKIFFNLNLKDFRVERNFEAAVKMYPMPSHDILHIVTGNSGLVEMAIFNAIGQRIWKGNINEQADIAVNLWARGVYIVRMLDSVGRPVVRKIVIE